MLPIFFHVDFINQEKSGRLLEVGFRTTDPQMLFRLAGFGFTVLVKTVRRARYCFGALDYPAVSQGEFRCLTHLGSTG